MTKVDDEAPKSAFELAMERLRRKDREAGIEERSLTQEQRTAIADVRRVYDAKLAEREILYDADRRKAADPEALAKLEEDYRRDRERISSDRDHKIEEIRKSS
jgi:hypothetical protein